MSTDGDANWGGVVEGLTTDFETVVARSLEDVRRYADAARLTPDAGERLLVVVEEIMRNVVTHGAPPPGSAITWRYAAEGGLVRLTFTDAGRPFDPRGQGTALPEEEAAGAAALKKTGGLGWRLVLAWCDVVSCKREDGTNRLELVMR